jgi:hypothetical protein
MAAPECVLDWNELSFRFMLRRPAVTLGDPFVAHGQDWMMSIEVEDDDGNVVESVGHAEVVSVNWIGAQVAGIGGYDILDERSGDLEKIASVLFDGGEIVAEMEDVVAVPEGRLLVLDRVWIDPKYRGQDLGPKSAIVALSTLQGVGGFAACYPSPFEGDPEPKDRAAAIERLSAIWSRVGFHHFQDGVWVLDLANNDLPNAAKDLGIELA